MKVEGLCGAWQVKTILAKHYISNIVKLRERSIGFTETSQKGHEKIMLERERDGTHTFRQVDMCKWQVGDPEAQMKSSLSDCTWLEY